MYLVVKKTKRSAHSKITDQTTLTFANFDLLSQFVLREGLDNCKVFDAKPINFTLQQTTMAEVDYVAE